MLRKKLQMRLMQISLAEHMTDKPGKPKGIPGLLHPCKAGESVSINGSAATSAANDNKTNILLSSRCSAFFFCPERTQQNKDFVAFRIEVCYNINRPVQRCGNDWRNDDELPGLSADSAGVFVLP